MSACRCPCRATTRASRSRCRCHGTAGNDRRRSPVRHHDRHRHESRMTKPLASRIALITGGSRGIGHALAIALAKEGAHVVATARTVGGLEELDDAIKAVGGTATLVPLELRDYEGIARLATALNERYGKLDILVGNAALGASNSPLDHFQAKEWDEVIAVNITANWHLIRAMHPLLLRSDAGRVVFLSSGAAANPRAYRGLYST